MVNNKQIALSILWKEKIKDLAMEGSSVIKKKNFEKKCTDQN